MRIGVIGAGFWTQFQIAGWREIPGVEIVAISNRTVSKAQALAERFAIPSVYADPAQMLVDENLNCVDVITEVDGHEPAVRLAAQKGVPVICQKPMARNLEEAQSMVEVCRNHQVPFFIHENWRYQTPFRAIADELRKGTIGAPFRARIQFSCSFPVWDNQPALKALSRFILADIGSHILDTARFLFGDATDLYCRTAHITPALLGEDVATVMMAMERCPTVTCEMSYASRMRDEAFPETLVLIEGALGTIELGKNRKLYVTTASGTAQRTVVVPAYPWMDPAYDLVHASIVECNRALAEALRGGAPAETTGEDNLRTVELVFASYDSATRDQKVDLGLESARSTG